MSLHGAPSSSIICHKFNINNNSDIGATENAQQRKYATKKPLFLRGKRGFKHYEKIKRVKNMSDMARREYLRQKERTKTIQWEPETEVEKHYIEMMMDMQTTHRKIGERAIIMLLDLVQDRSDLQFVLRLYRLLRIRRTRFSTDLTTKMVETFERLGDTESIEWIVKHPIELDLPPTRAIVHTVLNQLAEKEKYDDVLALYKNISTGKYMLKLTDDDVSLVTGILVKSEQYDKVLEAYNTKVKRRYREHQGRMSQGYRDLLKACEQMDDVETAGKIKKELLANTAESEETKQSILEEFSDLMKKVDGEGSEAADDASEEKDE